MKISLKIARRLPGIIKVGTIELKNDNYPFKSEIVENESFVKDLYNNILLCEPDNEGFNNWLSSLKSGMPRKQVYDYFIGEAKKHNSKAINPVEQVSLESLFDDNGHKRILLVMKESLGDLFIVTATFKDLKDKYPGHDLYVACEPQFASVLDGNPYVYKVIPYHPMFEQELAVIVHGQQKGLADVFVHPAIQSQRHLNYLSN